MHSGNCLRGKYGQCGKIWLPDNSYKYQFIVYCPDNLENEIGKFIFSLLLYVYILGIFKRLDQEANKISLLCKCTFFIFVWYHSMGVFINPPQYRTKNNSNEEENQTLSYKHHFSRDILLLCMKFL